MTDPSPPNRQRVLLLFIPQRLRTLIYAALPVGAWATGVFLHKLRRYTRLPKMDHDPATLPVPSWLTGIVERLFFTIVVASVGATAAGGMVGWLALKMAANWNRSCRVACCLENLS